MHQLEVFIPGANEVQVTIDVLAHEVRRQHLIVAIEDRIKLIIGLVDDLGADERLIPGERELGVVDTEALAAYPAAQAAPEGAPGDLDADPVVVAGAAPFRGLPDGFLAQLLRGDLRRRQYSFPVWPKNSQREAGVVRKPAYSYAMAWNTFQDNEIVFVRDKLTDEKMVEVGGCGEDKL